MSKTLLIYGTGLEFGWNLMRYNPYCRRKAKEGYNKVVVMCPPDEHHIWRDFATDFIETKRPDRADRWLHGPGLPAKIPSKIAKQFPGADKVVPNEKICTKGRVEYKTLNDPTFHGGRPCEVLIHARSTKKYNQGGRNYPIKKFETLIKEFSGKYSFGCIGTKNGSSLIDGAHDLRGENLSTLCRARIGMAKVVIGPSSGPMHLAHLCRTPIVVWSYRKYEKAIKGNNRYRYEKKWRAFKDVPVTVLDKWSWNPPVKEVIKAMKKYL